MRISFFQVGPRLNEDDRKLNFELLTPWLKAGGVLLLCSEPRGFLGSAIGFFHS
jgi:hypothetical protein